MSKSLNPNRQIVLNPKHKAILDEWMNNCHFDPYGDLTDEEKEQSPFVFIFHEKRYDVNRFKLHPIFLKRLVQMNNNLVLMELLFRVNFGISPDMKQMILGSRLHDMVVVHPDFLYRYTPDEQAYAILHELTHFLYGHEYRSKGLKYPILWNALCDWVAANAVEVLFAKKEQKGIKGIKGQWFRLEQATNLINGMAGKESASPYLMSVIKNILGDYEDVAADILYNEILARDDAPKVIQKIESEYTATEMCCDLHVSADEMFEPEQVEELSFAEQIDQNPAEVMQEWLEEFLNRPDMQDFEGTQQQLQDAMSQDLQQKGLSQEAADALSEKAMQMLKDMLNEQSQDPNITQEENGAQKASQNDASQKEQQQSQSQKQVQGNHQESQSALGKVKDFFSSLLSNEKTTEQNTASDKTGNRGNKGEQNSGDSSQSGQKFEKGKSDQSSTENNPNDVVQENENTQSDKGNMNPNPFPQKDNPEAEQTDEKGTGSPLPSNNDDAKMGQSDSDNGTSSPSDGCLGNKQNMSSHLNGGNQSHSQSDDNSQDAANSESGNNGSGRGQVSDMSSNATPMSGYTDENGQGGAFVKHEGTVGNSHISMSNDGRVSIQSLPQQGQGNGSATGTGKPKNMAMHSRLNQGGQPMPFKAQNNPKQLDSGSASDEIAKLMNLPSKNEDIKKQKDMESSQEMFNQMRQNGTLAGTGVEADAEFAYLEQNDGVVDWKTALSRYMREAHNRRHAGLDYSRQNRRASAIHTVQKKMGMGSRKTLIPAQKKIPQIDTVWVALDVSGSMGDKELQDALNEIYSILKTLKPRKVVINSFNAGLVEDIVLNDLDDLKDLKIQRGGGTEIYPLYQRLEEMGKQKSSDYPEFLIILTDMFLDTPKRPKDIDVYWVNLSEHSSELGRQLPADIGVLIDTKRPDEAKRITNRLKKKR